MSYRTDIEIARDARKQPIQLCCRCIETQASIDALGPSLVALIDRIDTWPATHAGPSLTWNSAHLKSNAGVGGDSFVLIEQSGRRYVGHTLSMLNRH